MKKHQMEQVRKAVSEIFGCEMDLIPMHNVTPLHKEASIDLELLEIENRQRLSIERDKEMREKRIQNRAHNRLIKNAKSIAKDTVSIVTKLPGAIKNTADKVRSLDVEQFEKWFFDIPTMKDLEEMYELEKRQNEWRYDHTKEDAVEKNNVTYLSRDFVDYED